MGPGLVPGALGCAFGGVNEFFDLGISRGVGEDFGPQGGGGGVRCVMLIFYLRFMTISL